MSKDPAQAVAHAIGFALGFATLLMGGAGFAGIVLSIVFGELPPVRAVVATGLMLGIPLASFRAFDRKRKAQTASL